MFRDVARAAGRALELLAKELIEAMKAQNLDAARNEHELSPAVVRVAYNAPSVYFLLKRVLDQYLAVSESVTREAVAQVQCECLGLFRRARGEGVNIEGGTEVLGSHSGREVGCGQFELLFSVYPCGEGVD